MTHDTHGPEYVRAQAQTKAAALIKKAARFAEANIPSPVFKKPFTDGKTRLMVRFDYPGVLKVIDLDTLETLAESAPGKPGELSADFVPPTPALARTVTL